MRSAQTFTTAFAVRSTSRASSRPSVDRITEIDVRDALVADRDDGEARASVEAQLAGFARSLGELASLLGSVRRIAELGEVRADRPQAFVERSARRRAADVGRRPMDAARGREALADGSVEIGQDRGRVLERDERELSLTPVHLDGGLEGEPARPAEPHPGPRVELVVLLEHDPALGVEHEVEVLDSRVPHGEEADALFAVEVKRHRPRSALAEKPDDRRAHRSRAGGFERVRRDVDACPERVVRPRGGGLHEGERRERAGEERRRGPHGVPSNRATVTSPWPW